MATDELVTVLHFVHGKYAGLDYPLGNDAFIAGRSTEAQLILADDAVSRKHARFFASRGRRWIRDLGSRNGTLVNGHAVEHHCLRIGDRLAIGSSLCHVESRIRGELTTQRAGEQPQRRASEDAVRSMTGSIEDIPLMDVLQWLATSRKTGALNVRDLAGGRRGSLHLREGRVFFAAIEGNDGMLPEKALLRMLHWQQGMFELDNVAIKDPPKRIDMSLEHLLIEAARQQDELAELARKVRLPTKNDTVRFVSPGPLRWGGLAQEELELVQDMVEMGGWQQMLDRSPKDDLELFRCLASLREKGVVEY